MRLVFLALPTMLLAAGCATMINQSTETIPVGSEPAGAVVTVDCGNAPMYGGLTPTVIKVPRSAQPCSVTVAKDGYAARTIDFQRQPSRATAINKVPGVALGTVLGAVAAVMVWNSSDDLDFPIIAFEGGQLLGAAPGNAFDRRSGAAWKQVPGDVFVTLDVLDGTS
jgi:hypothetical protein